MQMEKYKNIRLKMRRILALFVAVMLFCAPSFSQKKDTYRVRTVVIDPGHGGAKPGAQGGRVQEKTITLSIAKKFGKLITDNYPDVRVIYTRTTDVDISLAERAHIANRNKADLFVSIHANSHPTSAPTGVETFVMGLSESRANLEVAKKENADILLEADYQKNEAYKGFDPNAPESFVMLAMFQNAFIDKSLNFAQAIQNQYKQNLKTINRGVKQAELFVLYKTTCPSVLTEVGFISNPTEEAFMISDEGQAKIAISLFNAFSTFKATEEGTNKIANPKIDLPGYNVSAPAVAEQSADTAESEKATEAVVEKPVVVSERPVPTHELTPRMEIADTVTITMEEKPEAAPVRTPEKPAMSEKSGKTEVSSTPQAAVSAAPVKSVLPLPLNSAGANAKEFFTVQFLTTSKELHAGDPAFEGLQEVLVSRNGDLYCYSVGRFGSFNEADAYCKEMIKLTSFKDAWAVRRNVTIAKTHLLGQPQSVVEAKPQPKAEPKPQPKVEEKPQPKVEEKPQPKVEEKPVMPTETQQTQAQPKTEPKAEQPKKEAKPETKPEVKAEAKPKQLSADDMGTHYRIQFCTSPRFLKPGDSDLHGIKDIRHSRSGKFYIYSCGNYTSLAEARKRLAQIHKSTPFKDAYIYGIKDGRRFNVE